jgi:hypothetical protein
MGPIASANQQIRDAERQFSEQRLARLSAPHRLTDRLLDQLEELNLDEVPVVPASYAPALANLRQQLAGQDRLSRRVLSRLQPGTRTADVIDAIFTIQEVIAPPTLPADAFPFDDAAVI